MPPPDTERSARALNRLVVTRGKPDRAWRVKCLNRCAKSLREGEATGTSRDLQMRTGEFPQKWENSRGGMKARALIRLFPSCG